MVPSAPIESPLAALTLALSATLREDLRPRAVDLAQTTLVRLHHDDDAPLPQIRLLSFMGALRAIDEARSAPLPRPDEAYIAFVHAIDSLTPASRLCLGLRLLGHSLEEAIELMQWSPRQAKNLLGNAHAALPPFDQDDDVSGLAAHARISHFRAQHRRASGIRTEECPHSEQIWGASHGDTQADELPTLVEHTIRCGGCAEAWRLAWALDPRLSDEDLEVRSLTDEVTLGGIDAHTAESIRSMEAMAPEELRQAMLGADVSPTPIAIFERATHEPDAPPEKTHNLTYLLAAWGFVMVLAAWAALMAWGATN